MLAQLVQAILRRPVGSPQVMAGQLDQLAAALGGFGLGDSADGGQAGFPGAGADLAELVADVFRRQAVSRG